MAVTPPAQDLLARSAEVALLNTSSSRKQWPSDDDRYAAAETFDGTEAVSNA